MENLNQEIMEMESTIDGVIGVDDLVMVDEDTSIIAENSLGEEIVDKDANVAAIVGIDATGVVALAYGAKHIYSKVKERKARKKIAEMKVRIIDMLTDQGQLNEYSEEEISEMALYNCFREMNGWEIKLYIPRSERE